MSETVEIDDLRVEVRRSARRRTVDLIVDRFGDLVINVPEALPHSEIESIVRRKQEWIYTKVERKEIIIRPGGSKEYVSGEGFYYLGRKYRLKLFDRVAGEPAPALRLLNGRFWMVRSAASKGRDHFVAWYTRRGQAWIQSEIKPLKDRVRAEPRSIAVRDLKYRWASCNADGDMFFHWRVMLLPPRAVRYLLTHELVHLHEHNHSPAFYERLGRAAPDYRDFEKWLELNGDHYDLYTSGAFLPSLQKEHPQT